MSAAGAPLRQQWPGLVISRPAHSAHPSPAPARAGRLVGCRSRLPHVTALHGEDVLRMFAEEYERASGYRVPEVHLRRSQVLGMVVGGRLVGGGVLSAAVPLRTLQRLPRPEREKLASQLAGRSLVDVTCVWLRPGQRGGALSAVFWGALLRRIRASGAELVLFGTEQAGLHRLYRTVRADLLYRGPVTVDGEERDGWIFLKRNGSPWPVLVRMTLHRARRRTRRRQKGPSHAGRKGRWRRWPTPGSVPSTCTRPPWRSRN